MKNKIGLMKITIAFSIMILIISCGGKKEESKSESNSETGKKPVDVERIKELDAEFRASTEIDEKKAKEFIGMCMEYADANEKAKDAPVWLENAALVAGAIKKYKLKTQLFDYIIEKHRGYPNYTNVIYLQAMAWDSEMKDASIAKKYYLMVMEQHKDSGIIASTEARLETIDSLSYDQHVEMLVRKLKEEMK